MSESIRVTRFPDWLGHFYRIVLQCFKIGGRLLPWLPSPIVFYLEPDRITRNKEILMRFYGDPLGLTSYPLYFLASLFSADLAQISDGRIQCPVVVIAAQRDPLFPFDYTQKVYELIKAPHKEMLVFDLDKHLIMNECIDEIIGEIVKRLKVFV